jgi:hypothetical protein
MWKHMYPCSNNKLHCWVIILPMFGAYLNPGIFVSSFFGLCRYSGSSRYACKHVHKLSQGRFFCANVFYKILNDKLLLIWSGFNLLPAKMAVDNQCNNKFFCKNVFNFSHFSPTFCWHFFQNYKIDPYCYCVQCTKLNQCMPLIISDIFSKDWATGRVGHGERSGQSIDLERRHPIDGGYWKANLLPEGKQHLFTQFLKMYITYSS